MHLRPYWRLLLAAAALTAASCASSTPESPAAGDAGSPPAPLAEPLTAFESAAERTIVGLVETHRKADALAVAIDSGDGATIGAENLAFKAALDELTTAATALAAAESQIQAALTATSSAPPSLRRALSARDGVDVLTGGILDYGSHLKENCQAVSQAKDDLDRALAEADFDAIDAAKARLNGLKDDTLFTVLTRTTTSLVSGAFQSLNRGRVLVTQGVEKAWETGCNLIAGTAPCANGGAADGCVIAYDRLDGSGEASVPAGELTLVVTGQGHARGLVQGVRVESGGRTAVEVAVVPIAAARPGSLVNGQAPVQVRDAGTSPTDGGERVDAGDGGSAADAAGGSDAAAGTEDAGSGDAGGQEDAGAADGGAADVGVQQDGGGSATDGGFEYHNPPVENGRSLWGQVVLDQGYQTGSGLNGFLVTARGGAIEQTTLTHGGYFTFLSSLPDGTYTLTASRAGWNVTPVEVQVTLAGGTKYMSKSEGFKAESSFSTYLRGGIGTTVNGKVLDPEGRPLAYMTVAMFSPAWRYWATDLTDLDGFFQFGGIIDGDYEIVGVEDGRRFAPVSLPLTVAGPYLDDQGNLVGQLYAGQLTATADAASHPCAYDIDGVVRDLSGAPLAGATVQWNSLLGAQTVTTGADGKYTFPGITDCGREDALVFVSMEGVTFRRPFTFVKLETPRIVVPDID